MTIWIGLIALGLGLGTSLFLPVPQTLKTNFDAGQSLYALGEYEGAILEYSKIVKFKSPAVRADSVRVTFGDDLTLPVMAAAWYQLGNAYKRSGQHDRAVDAFHHVIDMESVAEDFRSLVQYQVAETRFLQKEFAEAAGSLGAPPLRQVVRHILPNAMGPVIVAGTIDVATAIIAESSLSFLGLGFPPDIPTWGRLLFDAKDNLDFAPHWAIFPGTAIFLTVLAINYIGDGLRDALDPRKVLGK